MLTVCPKCTLTLAVTAADLRIGQGYVRCGRCATVFNALLALSDTNSLDLPGLSPPPTVGYAATATVSVASARRATDPAPPAESAAVAEPVPESVPVPMPEPEPDTDSAEITVDPTLAAEPLDMVLEQTAAVAVPPAPAPQPSPVPETEAVDAEPEAIDEVPDVAALSGLEIHEAPLDAAGTMRNIVMEGSSVSQSEEFVDIDTIDSEIAAATRRALEAEARRSIAELDQDLGDSGTYAVPPDIDGAPQVPEPVETRLSESGSIYIHDRNSLYAPRLPPPKPPPSLLLWATYTVLLALVLGAQAIHYWRDDLALRNDWIGQSLTRVYTVLGLPLTPNWDLRGYDVRQLGAATNGTGDNAIRVRISLTNRAARAQPYPVLRLSLYNRYGKRVAARDLQPRDYLPREKANGLMPLAQQIDSEVAVMDPGPDASSFELDVCMPARHGLRCASDSPLRPAARS